MAIARGNESKEAQEFKRYIGVAPVFIKAINPNKEEHEALFNTTLEEAPKYLGEVKDNDGNTVCKSARIQVVFNPDVEKIGFEMPLVTMALFIQDRPRVGANSGKTQVIDKYGRTAWATPEELTTHAIPMYSNGPADIDKDYRPAYVGEEELMAFVKAYLCIPDVTVWDDNLKKRVPNTKVKPEECECRFDNLANLFKGDFSEIKDALGFQPTNKVKILLGVRTDTSTGRLFQTVYTRRFLRNSATNFNSLDKEIQENIKNAIESGRTIDTEYHAAAVHEYSVEPTGFTPSNTEVPSSDMPFEPASEDFATPWDV
jgi:hypothetical protein